MHLPIYEFECPIHGRFELILPITQANKDYIECGFSVNRLRDSDYCFKTAKKVWSLPGKIEYGAPTKVFVNNQTGEVYTPQTKYDKPPRGYKEIELRNPIERSKFEKEQQKILDATNEVVTHQLESQKSATTKNRHEDIKAKMNAVQRETVINPITDKPEMLEYTLDNKEKQLMEDVMKRSKKRKFRPRKSDVSFAVNHTDSSNLSEVR